MTRRIAAATAALAMLVVAGCSDDRLDSGPTVTFATSGPAPTPSDTTNPSTDTTPSTTFAPPATPAPDLGDPVVALSPLVDVRSPVDLAWRAGDTTLFVVGQDGTVVPVRDGTVGEPVLDMTRLTEADGEQGLLGLTFAADGATAYVNHTDRSGGDTVIASYIVNDSGTFDETSRVELLTIEQPYGNHNGGAVLVGPDDMLYIGMGDGGSANDPERRSLNVTSLLGKILRIDPTPSGDRPYTVPADNPFVDVPGAQPEIWSVGVRNPWRMSFDSATGDLWFGDVGQGQWEEIDVAWAADGGGRGLNFGWSAWEGTHRFNEDQPADGVTPPIYEYEHGDAGCSVSGGAVYRGAAIPALVGWYVFGDYCSGNIYGLRVQDRVLVDTLLLGTLPELSAVRAGPDGELYALSLGGTVAAIIPA